MWLSVAKLANLLNKSEQAVRKALATNKYVTARYSDSHRRGGSNGKVWEISASDPAIPSSIRRQLGVEESVEEQLKKNLDEVPKITVNPAMIDDEKTSRRIRVLRLIQHIPSGVGKGESYERIAQDEGISVPTLYRWATEAKRGKLVPNKVSAPVALKAESGPVKIEVKSRSFTPSAIQYGLSMLLQNPLMDVKKAYERLTAEAEGKNWEIGSLRSFYNAVYQVPDVVKILARSGKRGLEAVIKPPIERDMSFVNVYDILIGDQHIFDYTVLDDEGEPIRPQMFAWVDAKSRYFTGLWPVMGNYDQYAVGFALREACRWGIPQSLYNDWGKPEGSKYIEQLRRQLGGKTSFKQGYDDIGYVVEQTKAKPRNAQAKAIESYFYHTFENPLKQRGLPGYSRRDLDDKANEQIQARLRKAIKNKKLLHAKAFFEIVLEVLDEWHKHTMTIDKSVPEEVFLDGITKNIHRFDDQTLDFMFWPAVKRTVKNSMIEMTLDGFGKCRWHAAELASLCHRSKRTQVEVRFNPYDASHVYVLDHEQKSICIAERWGKDNPSDMGAVSKKIRRQNQLVGWFCDVMRQIAKPEIMIQRISAYEIAAAKAAKLAQERTEINKIIVDEDKVNRKIIAISEKLDAERQMEQERERRKCYGEA